MNIDEAVDRLEIVLTNGEFRGDDEDYKALEAVLAELAECRAITIKAVEIGKHQAEEWDRYWTAVGIGTADISVDDAITLWQEREKELADYRAMAAELTFMGVSLKWAMHQRANGKWFISEINEYCETPLDAWRKMKEVG